MLQGKETKNLETAFIFNQYFPKNATDNGENVNALDVCISLCLVFSPFTDAYTDVWNNTSLTKF